MNGIVDTLMNLFVFAFVGLLIWLYFKETPSDEKRRKNSPHGDV
jgi:hypothetical protein